MTKYVDYVKYLKYVKIYKMSFLKRIIRVDVEEYTGCFHNCVPPNGSEVVGTLMHLWLGLWLLGHIARETTLWV